MKNNRFKEAFPVSSTSLLRSYRKHMADLVGETDFLSPSHGFERLAHFALIDDLLIQLFYLEHGRKPGSEVRDGIGDRVEALGPAHAPFVNVVPPSSKAGLWLTRGKSGKEESQNEQVTFNYKRP